MLQIYIYYQLEQEHIATARRAVEYLFSRAHPFCHSTRLMQREWHADNPDNLLTWMEIYEDVSDAEGLQECLQRALPESGLLPVIQGQRHIECFLPLA